MKKIIFILIVIIITINLSANAQVEIRKAAELYINFAEDIMDINNSNEKSVDEAILNLEKAIEVDKEYGEAYYLLGITILKKIDYIKWNTRMLIRIDCSKGKIYINLRKLYKKAKDALKKAILYEEGDERIRELLPRINFELIGPNINYKISKIKIIENEDIYLVYDRN